jgi:Spy/CpxP family protein refolding chaperone
MRPHVQGGLVTALLTLLVVNLGAAQPAPQPPGFPWWKDEKVVKELALTTDQSNRIDNVFRATYPQLFQSREELDKQEAELSRLIEINADEAQVSRQVDKVESVRAGLNKTRTLMLLHMRQVLTPKQNVKFKAVHEQWQRDHPRPPRPEDPKTQDPRNRTETR